MCFDEYRILTIAYIYICLLLSSHSYIHGPINSEYKNSIQIPIQR